MVYVAPVPFSVSLGGRSTRVWGHLVTPSYFTTLGVHAFLGHFFSPAQTPPNASPSVILSQRFWREYLASNPSIVGRTIRINGHPCTITGVAPQDFLGASPAMFPADLWLPVTVDATFAPELGNDALHRHDLTMFQMVARIRPSVTETAAFTALNAAAQQIADTYGDPDRNRKGPRVTLLDGGKVLPLRKQDLPFFKDFLLLLGGLLLLIACANVTNMMLARAAGRRGEFALRLALGAGRVRLIRQLLTEPLLLTACTAPLAFLFSLWIMHALSSLRMPLPIPISLNLLPDWRALAFTCVLTGLAGIGIGLAPALNATRADLVSALKQGSGAHLRAHRAISLRNALVLCQMAASLALLVVTGYMSIGIQTTIGVQQGFDPKNLYLISLDPVRDGFSPTLAASFLEKLLRRVQNLPGITSACLTDTLPVSLDGNPGVFVSAFGPSNETPPESYWARHHIVGRGYFETAGIHILSGRGFNAQDEAGTTTAVILSQKAAEQFFPGQDAVGRRIEIRNGAAGGGLGAMPGTIDFRAGVLAQGAHPFQVAGVVANVSEDLVASKKHPAVYFPLLIAGASQPSLRGVTLLVRAAPGLDPIPPIRREISALDANVTPFNATSMTEHISQFMSSLTAATWTYGVMGLFGLVLASVGLAGVTAYSVARRAREIGIRMALGAQTHDVLRLVMKQGAALVALGVASGIAFALAAIRALSALFFTVASVQGYDPLLLLGAPSLLAAIGLIACYIPARRSARIDPAATLRTE